MDDVIGEVEQTLTVGDDDHGAALVADRGECGVDLGFGGGVQVGGGFVEDHDGPVAGQGTGEGDALALPHAEAVAALPNGGVPTVGELRHDVGEAGERCSVQHFVGHRLVGQRLVGQRVSPGGVADEFAQGARWQHGALRNPGELGVPLLGWHVGKVVSCAVGSDEVDVPAQ